MINCTKYILSKKSKRINQKRPACDKLQNVQQDVKDNPPKWKDTSFLHEQRLQTGSVTTFYKSYDFFKYIKYK